LLYPIRFIRH